MDSNALKQLTESQDKAQDGITVKQILCMHEFRPIDGITQCVICNISEVPYAYFWMRRGYRNLSEITHADVIGIALAVANGTRANRVTLIENRHNQDEVRLARGIRDSTPENLAVHEDRKHLLEEYHRLNSIVSGIRMYLRGVE